MAPRIGERGEGPQPHQSAGHTELYGLLGPTAGWGRIIRSGSILGSGKCPSGFGAREGLRLVSGKVPLTKSGSVCCPRCRKSLVGKGVRLPAAQTGTPTIPTQMYCRSPTSFIPQYSSLLTPGLCGALGGTRAAFRLLQGGSGTLPEGT